jgi:hypothetical protein
MQELKGKPSTEYCFFLSPWQTAYQFSPGQGLSVDVSKFGGRINATNVGKKNFGEEKALPIKVFNGRSNRF